jgi:hypothetical protein
MGSEFISARHRFCHSSISLQAQFLSHREPKFTARAPRVPSAPSSRGSDRSELACLEKHPPKVPGKIAEVATPQQEQAEGILDDRSTIWGIELEGGVLPSDGSSLACDTTVVIDAKKIWDHPEGTQQPHQATVDSCDKPRSLTTRGPDEHSRLSPRVASRFFLKNVPGSSLREDRFTPVPDWEDRPDREPEVQALDDHLGHPHPSLGWDCPLDQEIGSSLDDYGRTRSSPMAGKRTSGN